MQVRKLGVWFSLCQHELATLAKLHHRCHLLKLETYAMSSSRQIESRCITRADFVRYREAIVTWLQWCLILPE